MSKEIKFVCTGCGEIVDTAQKPCRCCGKSERWITEQAYWADKEIADDEPEVWTTSLNDFTESDWDGFAGASRFAGNEEPMIALFGQRTLQNFEEGYMLEVIVDYAGIYAVIEPDDPDDNAESYYMTLASGWTKPMAKAAAMGIFNDPAFIEDPMEWVRDNVK